VWFHINVMQRLDSQTVTLVRSQTLQIRQAVLLTFCTAVPEQCWWRLRHLSAKEWQRLLYWLDTSGLALYFLDRIMELGQSEMFPVEVLLRLQQNLEDNKARTAAMIAESTEIHRSFQCAGLSYATLKGFSLWPQSVHKLTLRSQLDLDFLIAEQSAARARQILEARGYRLRSISGRTWEFTTDYDSAHTMKDLYKATQPRSVELHIETGSSSDSLLQHVEKVTFNGSCMPMLAPVDLFLGQVLHVYKHLSSDFSRTAHVIEFRRHVLARFIDDDFWKALRARAEGDPKATTALGFVTMLVTHVMGDFAPQALTGWTVESLPLPARLWIELYGAEALLASFPGSKLHLLLQKEMQAVGIPAKRSLRQTLLPNRWPPAIALGTPDEHFPARIRRYRRQMQFILFRLRFHTFEGIRYLCEAVRWRKYINERRPFDRVDVSTRQTHDNCLTEP
jgi:hypothetical protein